MRRPSPTFWDGRRVLVTGHTGFKGAWCLMLLRALGAEVAGFSLPGAVSDPNLFDAARLAELCDDRRGDLRDLEAVRTAVSGSGATVVLHMAAQPIVRLSYREPVETFAANVMGTIHLLEACRGLPGMEAVLVVTSDKCYDNQEQVWPYREGDALGGRDPYSASKGAAEVVARSYALSFFNAPGAARVATGRAGNVIGGGDWAADRLIPDLVRGAGAGSVVEVRNPASIRPWQHVIDPVCGYLLAIEHMVGRSTWAGFDSWNFGPNPGEELPVHEVVDVFRQQFGGRPEVAFGTPAPVEHEANLLRVDPTKAKVELGWRPLFTNTEAVAAAADWSQAFLGGGDARELANRDLQRALSA